MLADGTNTSLYGKCRIAEQISTTWTYFHPDALGSVRQLSDSTGQISLAQSYKSYGDVLSSSGNVSSNYSFSGESKLIAITKLFSFIIVHQG